MSDAALPAVIYCRISNDAKGRLLGVVRQEQACRRLAEQCGWPDVELYVDNNVSAYSGELRPAYQRMLADLKDGRLSGVVAWDADRLHRSTRELEDFIDVIEATGAPVVMVTSGHADFASATGRMHARMTGNIARYESEHKVERTTAGHASLAEAGRWKGGPRPYGYDVPRDNHGRSLRNGHLIVVPEEAAIVREAAARVLAGESIYRVCTDLNARGVPTSKGARWRTQTLRRILTNPTTVAKRDYRGVIVADALWPPLLEEEDWQQLRLLLGHHRSPRSATPGNTPGGPWVFLLTGGIAICGVCGTNLHAHMRETGVRSYNCMSGPDKEGCGGVSCSARLLDLFVVTAVLERYQRPATEPEAPTQGIEAATVPQQLQQGQAELAKLFADGQLSHDAWRMIRVGLDALETQGVAAGHSGDDPPQVLVDQWQTLPHGGGLGVGGAFSRVKLVSSCQALRRFPSGAYSLVTSLTPTSLVATDAPAGHALAQRRSLSGLDRVWGLGVMFSALLVGSHRHPQVDRVSQNCSVDPDGAPVATIGRGVQARLGPVIG